MEEIKITITNEGQVVIEVNGVKGAACKELTKNLEKVLGDVVESKKKTEFYEQGVTTNQQQSQKS
ncbi:MAG: DUF2997 domain-containing protein, partial [Nanoarchaeota archaeon]